ncbi:MAG: hypothetical protein ACSLFL_12035 [Alphaproteobacteria bacterium]
MTPAIMITNAKADGVTVFLTPAGTVRLRGPQAALAKWVPVLRLHKPALAALLQAPETGLVPVGPEWDASDWQAHFNERAGVAEYDGALPRHEAERQAYLCCIAEWLCQNPVTSDPGSCAWCGRGDLTYGPVMPYGDAIHGHTWLHGECWAAWYAKRRQAAVEALAGFGVAGSEEAPVIVDGRLR